jgi:hypothetical protein
MTDPKIQAIKEKLKKLIAKEASARDIGNQAEADAFASKIQELLLAYELEIEELGGTNEVYQIADEKYDCEGLTRPHESDWVTIMYTACGPAAFCEVLTMTKSLNVRIYGNDNNRELLHFMVAQLVVKIRELARKSFKEYHGMDKRNTYFRSFYKGAAHAIHVRLRKEKESQAQTYGIVLSRGHMVKDYMNKWLEDRGIKLRQIKPKKSSSYDGYQNGWKAGESVGINKGVGGNKETTKLN